MRATSVKATVEPEEEVMIPWHFNDKPRESPKAVYYIDVSKALETTACVELQNRVNTWKARYYALLVAAGAFVFIACRIIYDLA